MPKEKQDPTLPFWDELSAEERNAFHSLTSTERETLAEFAAVSAEG